MASTASRRGRGVATGLHVLDPETGRWNIVAAERQCGGMDAVLIGFATRQRGLVTAVDVAGPGLGDLAGRRIVRRQASSGAEPLFTHLLSQAGIDAAAFEWIGPVRSEADAALAILRGEADAAFGLEALAAQYRLGFTPLIEEQFDLLVDRRAWFEPEMQAFLAFCRSPDFAKQAAALTGYDLAGAGTVRWNA